VEKRAVSPGRGGGKKQGGVAMSPAEKRELRDNLAAKGITLDKAGEAVKVPGWLLNLYLTEDSNPVPKRIVDGLKKLLA
jgi:hypothetical protein